MIRKARAERAALRSLIRENRAASRINRRGTGSLTAHALAAGLAPKAARTVASSLRRAAAKLGIAGEPGRAHAGRRMRHCTRYTVADVARAAELYRPRLPAYRAARDRFLLAA